MMQRLLNLVHRARREKFVRDTLILQVATVYTQGTYFITSVLTAKWLGKGEYGRWGTSRELYMLMFFMVSLGLTNAAVSRYAHAKGRGDEGGSLMALASLLKLGAIVSTVMILLGVFVAPAAAAEWYQDRHVGVVTSVLCFAVASEVLRSLALAILNGTRQMKAYAFFDITTNTLRVVLVAAALLISQTSMAVAFAFLAHGFASGLLALRAYAQARRRDGALAPPPLRKVLAAVPGAPVRDFFGLSFLLALSKAMNTVVPRLGMLFIPALAVTSAAGFRANGGYYVGMVLTMVLSGGIGAIATNLLPTLGQKMGRSDVPIEEMGHTIRRLSLTAGGLAVAATLVSVPIMWFVVNYVYGADYADGFQYYLALASGNLFIGFAVVVEPFYIYAHRMHIHVAQSVVYASLATAGIYSATVAFGPMGAAWAGGLCRVFVLFHLVYIGFYFRRARKRRAGPPASIEGTTP